MTDDLHCSLVFLEEYICQLVGLPHFFLVLFFHGKSVSMQVVTYINLIPWVVSLCLGIVLPYVISLLLSFCLFCRNYIISDEELYVLGVS